MTCQVVPGRQKCPVLGSLDKRGKGVLFQHNAAAGWVSSRTSYECADKLVHSCPMSRSSKLNKPTCPLDMLPVWRYDDKAILD